MAVVIVEDRGYKDPPSCCTYNLYNITPPSDDDDEDVATEATDEEAGD